jgi:hypothetical protein
MPLPPPPVPHAPRRPVPPPPHPPGRPPPRGLHIYSFRLNVSAFCGAGGAFRGCLGGIMEVSGGVMGY